LVAALEPYGLEVGRQMVMTALAVAALLALTGPAAAFTRAPVTGAVDPAITQANVHATVCRLAYTKAVRPSKEWSASVKARLLIEQHLPGKIQDYELDHLIPLGIGGAPRDLANLWLQTWPEARAKDEDEAALHHAMCTGRLTLEQAQRRILEQWGPRP
jgi:hypothetical protein